LKILVIRLSSFGDIILTTPVLAALKARYPEACIDFLVMDRFTDAISGNPHIDELICFQKDRIKGLLSLARFALTLRQRNYDVIIDLHAKLRSILICAFLRTRVLRYKKRALWKTIAVSLGLCRYHVDDTIVRNYFGPLRHLAINYTSESLRFDFEPSDASAVALYKNSVVMAPGAANFTKRWPLIYYAELGKKLFQDIVLIGGPEDRIECETIRKRIGSRCTNLAGKLSLKQSGALISTARFVITNDSGPFHMARALSRKVFVFFGPTDPNMFTFRQDQILIYDGIKCSPCSLHGDKKCPLGHFRCMLNLTPERVLGIIDRWTT
jgi:lipopolysaccharide heptosyltransferase II